MSIVNITRCVDTKTVGFYSQYTGRTTGRLLHFLYDVYKIPSADGFTYGCGEVKYGTELIATYEWYLDTDIPKFTFSEERNYLIKLQEETISNLIKE